MCSPLLPPGGGEWGKGAGVVLHDLEEVTYSTP